MVFIKDRGKVGYDTRTRVLRDKKKKAGICGGHNFICYAPFTVRPTLVSSDFNATW